MVNLKEIELLYNFIPSPCVILEPAASSFTVAFVNNAFLKITSSNRDELIGCPFQNVYSVNQADQGDTMIHFKHALDHVLSAKTPNQLARFRYNVPFASAGEQEVRYWNIDTYPLLEESGIVCYIVQSFTDVSALVTAEIKLKSINRYEARANDSPFCNDEDSTANRMIGVLGNISSRKKAEAELQLLKNTFAEVFQLNPLPMWTYDPRTLAFLDVNEEAVAHYGYSKVEFLAMTIRDIRPEDDTEDFLKRFRLEVLPGKSHSLIARHRKKSGEIILVNIKGNSIHYGTREARIVVAIDITEKTRYEKALVDSERRFKTLIQESSDLIAIIELEGTYKYVSPTIERLMGSIPGQVIGRNAFHAVHESDRDLLFEQLQMLGEKKSIKLAPYRLTDPLGRTHWMETIVTDMRSDEAIAGIICNARIVTDRIEQELKIKEHFERFNIVSKATSDTIWDLNHITGKVIWNQGIQMIFGYDSLESDYQFWYDRVHPDDVERVTGVVQHNVEHKLSRWTSEYRFKCANGVYKDVLDRGFLIFDSETGKVVKMIGAIQDISERVAYTKAVEENNNKLKDIAWTQSHLVRGPLTSILGLMALLKDPSTDESTRTSVLEYLEQSATRLDQTIMEIIDKSHHAVKGS